MVGNLLLNVELQSPQRPLVHRRIRTEGSSAFAVGHPRRNAQPTGGQRQHLLTQIKLKVNCEKQTTLEPTDIRYTRFIEYHPNDLRKQLTVNISIVTDVRGERVPFSSVLTIYDCLLLAKMDTPGGYSGELLYSSFKSCPHRLITIYLLNLLNYMYNGELQEQ